jgi:hypothetical protein
MVKPKCIKLRLQREEWGQGKQDTKGGCTKKIVYWNYVGVPG